MVNNVISGSLGAVAKRDTAPARTRASPNVSQISQNKRPIKSVMVLPSPPVLVSYSSPSPHSLLWDTIYVSVSISVGAFHRDIRRPKAVCECTLFLGVILGTPYGLKVLNDSPNRQCRFVLFEMEKLGAYAQRGRECFLVCFPFTLIYFSSYEIHTDVST